MSQSKPTREKTVLEYFTISGDQCLCKIEIEKEGKKSECGSKMSNKTSNLKRHIQRHHIEVFKILETKSPVASLSEAGTSSGVSTYVGGIKDYFPSNKVVVCMTAEKFKSHIVEMVVTNSIPLLFFSQKPFTGLNGEMARKLNVSLDRENIRKLVINEANIQRNQLKEILKDRFIYLKMDACTRHCTNYFAINARFVDKDNITQTQTLAVRDTHAEHGSQYLQILIEDVLNDFEIKKEHVLSIITDNASNMIKTIEKLNENLDSSECEINSSTLESAFEEGFDTENDDNLDGVLEESCKMTTIKHMRCAVHTLQLAIRDGLKEKHASALIAKFRQVSVAARTPKIDSILKRRVGKGAIIDQATRWGSTFLMLQRLLELKDVLEDLDNTNVSLTESQWRQCKEMVDLLYGPFIATKNLQAEDLSPGKFLIEWRSMIFKLDKVGGLVAEGIVSSMKKRETLLMENQILLAGVFVDPSARILLSEEQCELAKQVLCDISMRKNGLSEKLMQSRVREELISDSESEASVGSEDVDFDSYLDKIQKAKKRQRLNTQNSPVFRQRSPVEAEIRKFRENFFKELKIVEDIDRSSKVSVEEALALYPDGISEVARIVTAMPPTQVSVERLFSALRLIKSDLRASMKADLAEAILFLRTFYA